MKKIIIILTIIAFETKAQNVQLSTERVWAERVSPTTYALQASDFYKYQIYQGNSFKNITWKNPLVLIKTLEVSAKPDERLFFAAVINRDTLYFSERRLWLENAPNFRDLGGLKTENGRKVAWGKIFRCGEIGKLNESELSVIKRENIRNVVDFRNEQEVKQSPDKYPADYEINKVWASITPSNSVGMKDFSTLMSNPNASKTEAIALFETFYAKMPENIKNYASFFETLLNAKPNEASLFHCTAGKDRTGFGSALILSALGVDEKTIIEEYYLSNRYTQYLAKSGVIAQAKPEIAEVLAGVEPQYIEATLKTIKDKYGSVNKMLESELGIDEKKRKMLIEKYTY